MFGISSRFWKDDSGATAIEYALIASFIGMAIVVTVGQVGTNLNAVFTEVKTGFS